MAEYKKMTDCDVIDPKDPWKNDKLKRKKVAEDFTVILDGINNQPFVISIDSAYGTGKTFFIKRWAEDLKNTGIIACYYNAWNTDFQTDPLVPFVNSIIKQLPKDVNDKLQESFENLVGVLKTAGNFAFKCFTGRDNVVGEGAKLAQQVVELVQGVGRDFIENNDQTISIIEAFKTKLAEEAKKRKIAIFVDELERCRPTYAIDLLEIIKHLFNVPNVIFVLATDRQQLKYTITKLYGANMDGDGYLRRFIDLELHLPVPDRSTFCSYVQDLYDIKNEKLGVHHIDGWDYFKEQFVFWAEIYKLSLREIEQMWIEVSYLAHIMPEERQKISPVLSWLLIVKSKDIEQFYNFKNCDKKSIYNYLFSKIPTSVAENNRCYENFKTYLEICITNPDELTTRYRNTEDINKDPVAKTWYYMHMNGSVYEEETPLSGYMCNLLAYISPVPDSNML